MNIKDLTIEEKVGQMIMVGLDDNYVTNRMKKLIVEHKIGGVILYRKNFKTYEDMIKLISDLKKTNQNNKIPLFIAIDQEGGRVNRLPPEILNLPAPYKIVRQNDINLVKESANILATILRKSGFNLDFAPVLDIKRFDDNHAIGDRCYGENKEEVLKFGLPVMKELKSKKILSVVKHFPGHGATKKDSHHFLPKIKTDIKILEKEDMDIFGQAIKEGADAVLVGHLIVKGANEIYPASLSRRFITKYIRKKYRYNKLIITDDMRMKSIRFVYGAQFAIKKAFEAGNDIIVFRLSEREEEKAIDNIVRLVKKNQIKESRINKSVERIIKTKEKYEITDEQVIGDLDIESINKNIERIRNIVFK